MKCLIIAAGRGSRLAHQFCYKPLIQVGGITLIGRVIRTVISAGCNDFYVVTGYGANRVNQHLKQIQKKEKCYITTIYNPRWLKENGLSVLAARGVIKEKFFLLMADHIFDSRILLDLSSCHLSEDEVFLAVDTHTKNNPHVDYEDVTKVQVNNGFITNIGKNIGKYNAFDTGIFYSTPALFTALEESIKSDDFTLSGGIKVMMAKKKARVMDIGEKLWIDVDDGHALQKAENIISLLPVN